MKLLRTPFAENQWTVHAARLADSLKGLSELEKKLHLMDDDELEGYLREKVKGYSLPELHVGVKPDQTLPYQANPRERLTTSLKKVPAALAEIRLRLERGHLKLVTYQSDQWIAHTFCKNKNRINPETGLDAIRLLTDYRIFNSASWWPPQWNMDCPTIEKIKASIPKTAKLMS